MATQNFDKLNILKRYSEPYHEYFGVMMLTKEQKRQRERLAVLLEEAIAVFFEMYRTRQEMGVLSEVQLKQEFTYLVYDVVSGKGYFEDEAQEDKYITDLVNETYRATEENLAKHPNDYDYTGNKPYWISDDRAMFIAENEANTIINGYEFEEAKAQGKTHKIWKSYADDKVRPTHQEVDVTMIPIDDYFDVGAAQLLYPKDITSEFSTGIDHPEEIINCRCCALYI